MMRDYVEKELLESPTLFLCGCDCISFFGSHNLEKNADILELADDGQIRLQILYVTKILLATYNSV